MTTSAPVVTIDGPSGSGKGTISRAVARQVGWHLLDSGALYRLVAVAGETAGVATNDIAGHARLAQQMAIEFQTTAAGDEIIFLDGFDVTAQVRSEQGGQGASRVAAWPAVREALFSRQLAFAQLPGLVADGRDMGTALFPHAALKIFLTASAAERARRRYNQLKDKGSNVSLADLTRELTERDQRDSNRAASPLKPANDALLLDSTHISIDQVVAQVLKAGRERALWK
jgi:CMP/dCMP kinase